MSYSRTCPNCGQDYIPDLAKRDDWHTKSREKGLIQNVWPDATPIQREQLQTGICSDKCWDEFLGTMDEQLIGDEDHGRA